MKKLLVLCLGMLLASSMFAVITGSAHDLSAQAWTSGEICIVCHTPHNAASTLVPLWDHDTSVAAWSPYVDTGDLTLDSTPGAPQGCSVACLSCHDGTVAVDSFGGATGTNTIGTFGSSDPNDNVGTDLTDDHPISFTYDAALATADGELHDPTGTSAGLPVTAGNIDAVMLRGGDQLECCSCHDVHNTECVACPSLLLKSNAGSALCLTCHNK